MTRTRRHLSNDRACLWFACAVALCAGYYLTFIRLGAAIDAQNDLTATAASNIRANSEIGSIRPRLERREHELDVMLHDFDVRADHATVVARFIAASARIAARHHTTVLQIDERPVRSIASGDRQPLAAGAPPAAIPLEAIPLEAIPLDVSLTGSYRDLLDTIRDFARAPVAMRIEVATLERTSPADDVRDVPLVARLHINVERISDDGTTLTPETSHARFL